MSALDACKMHGNSACEIFFEREKRVVGADDVDRVTLFDGKFHAWNDSKGGEAIDSRGRQRDVTDNGCSADREFRKANAVHRAPPGAGRFGFTRFVMSSTMREVGGNS